MTKEESPDPRRRLGKNLDNPSENASNDKTPDEEKGASNKDIENREGSLAEPGNDDGLAPSGDMITNTGADIGSKQTDADAASG